VSIQAEKKTWIQRWAEGIEVSGLSSLVLLLIEATYAFRFLGNHLFLITRPLMSGILEETTIERAATLLNNPESLAQLKAHLEGRDI